MLGRDILMPIGPMARTDNETPIDFYNRLDEEFSFTLDPCCTPDTAKCSKFYTPDNNGLIQDWSGERVFVNPPYNDCYSWLMKAVTSGAELVVCLLPARTDTQWFHDLVLPIADEVRFVRGRLKFSGESAGAPFPNIVVVYKFNDKDVDLVSYEA